MAAWLARHARIENVFFPGEARHPDAEVVRRLLPTDTYGAMVSFEIRGARRPEIFAFMDAAQRSKEAGGAPMRLR